MKRTGFTMIELIFVIVILGILAAVALPKFTGVSEQAKVGKLQAYVGTLNRTILPAYWSDSMMGGEEGKIVDLNVSGKINADLTPPDKIVASFGKLADSDYDFNATDVTAPVKDAKGYVASGTYNGVLYTVVCKDGNVTVAPMCDLYNAGTKKYMLNSNL
ncbi:MAG: type II secretion system protein [Sulfurimonas sp.]|nr:type II secretion system protein [Sulfurimonas sp.]